MSQNNSDQMKQCLSQTDNGPGDQKGGSVNQTDPTATETHPATSAEPSGSMGNRPTTSAEPSGSMGNRPTTSAKSSSSMGHESPGGAADVRPETPQSSASGLGECRPSEGQPMDTSGASGSHTAPPLRDSYPIAQLRRMQDFRRDFDRTLLWKGHTLLVDMEWLKKGDIVPFRGRDAWDGDHVKFPHLYPRPASHKAPSRWEVTCRALEGLSTGSFSVRDIQNAILSYNSSNKDKWSFDVLYDYGRKLHELENNLPSVIPKMAKLALDLPSLIQRSIPLLRQQQTRAVTLSQRQISCLLANAFFCTFPHRNDTSAGSEYASFPSINFSSLFASRSDPEKQRLKVEKLRAIFHYFDTVTKSPEAVDGLVTFERICVPPSQLPDWTKQKKLLTNLHVSADGAIEAEGTGMLQVDFASRFVGGGVLQSGLVQEEILFLMSPELIVARLFTEKLDDNECLRITGPQMFSLTQGYSRSFSWAGPLHDRTQRDAWKRRYRQIVAIDALDFKNTREQYSKDSITRELNKAYVGFSGQPKTAIATGNWGCGAFRGDPQLKALIQLMAAAAAERDVAFFTFRNTHLASEIQRMHEILSRNGVTVDRLYKLLKEYCAHHSRERPPHKDLYRFIREKTGLSSSSL